MSRTRLRVAGVGWLVAQYAWWRVTGSVAAGRRVVRALGQGDEDLRTIAAMLLAKAGPRAEPLLREALRRREGLSLALGVLGDIGRPDVEGELASFLSDPDPAVERAAHDALRTLRLRHGAPVQ